MLILTFFFQFLFGYIDSDSTLRSDGFDLRAKSSRRRRTIWVLKGQGKTSYVAKGLDHTGFTGSLRQTVPHSRRAVGRWLQRVLIGEREHHGVCLRQKRKDNV